MEPQPHEEMFYELMWRVHSQGHPLPLPWWAQQYFRQWSDKFDSGLFDTKQGAFASNAAYRYWHMVGVKDARQESLVGQAGEVEPVYDKYSLSFFLFDPTNWELHFPQHPVSGTPFALDQRLAAGYLPIVVTKYRSPLGVEVQQRVLATTVGPDQKSMVLVRFSAKLLQATSRKVWLCLCLSAAGPTGFQRHDRAGRFVDDRRLTFMQYLPSESRVLINSGLGPVFDKPPSAFGTYGNGTSKDPQFYIEQSPFRHLAVNGSLNGREVAVDNIAGLCSGAFVWPMELTSPAPEFGLDVRLPVDDFRGAGDLSVLRSANADALEANSTSWWTAKLDGSGMQGLFPSQVRHLWDLFRICRSNLLILADDGQIHPGPTIYDEFWIRDSSVEAIAAAQVGDENLARRQLGYWHPIHLNFADGQIDGVSMRGFYGGKHEKDDREWDSNGQALWAFGRFDRLLGTGANFGRGLFTPYVIDAARWIRDNRTQFGLLHSGWSAEHIGEKNKPHYWDDFWGVAGLWEAARLAQRIGAREADEIWQAYDSLREATAASIRWVLSQQHNAGHWETFVPTGPADVGLLDSTMIGTLCYFHPCRLYDGMKLGEDVDRAARSTLYTILGHFVDGGGLRHDASWNCFGPYVTMQLAHAFLLIGDLDNMDKCLRWIVGNAAYAHVSRPDSTNPWQVTLGAWNEQHCYPIAKDFADFPDRAWYMGDIPHGWACAEFMLLLRDILFFECAEDSDPQIYLAPGLMPHWLTDDESIGVTNAATVFGQPFGYTLRHLAASRRIEINIVQPAPPQVRYVYPCRFGRTIRSVTSNGSPASTSRNDVLLPPGTTTAVILYES